MSSAPKPTPPQETSAATTGTNVSTAIANSFLQNPNEIGPDGSKVTKQTGSYTWTDQYTGKSYTVPKSTVVTTLSPAQKNIKAQQDAASLNLASLGNNLSSTLGDKLKGNFTIDNESTEARLAELGSKRLDPRFAEQRQDLETKLSNQGIKLGSAAYDRAMRGFGEQENDAYNQLFLSGRAQASQEQFAEDNQRINQVGALMSGGQVSQPTFQTGFQPTNIPTTNNASIIGNYDQANFQRYQANQAGIGSAIGSLGSLFTLSDKRTKKNIKPIGDLQGHKVYEYEYKGDNQKQIGVMAQEVEKDRPDAVAEGSDGLKRVNYGALFGSGGMKGVTA